MPQHYDDKRRQREGMIPQGFHAPVLIDEPVRPGPAPQEEEIGPPPEGVGMEPPMSPDEFNIEPGITDEEGLPNTATVVGFEGNTVILRDEAGETLKVPLEAFPVPPEEGMELSRAVVSEVTGDVVVALVGQEQSLVEIPVAELQDEFNVGDYFWMPQPPSSPEMMGPMRDPEL